MAVVVVRMMEPMNAEDDVNNDDDEKLEGGDGKVG